MCEGKGGTEAAALKSGRRASAGAEAAAVGDEMLLFMVRGQSLAASIMACQFAPEWPNKGRLTAQSCPSQQRAGIRA
jgi:hypothetical protein